MAAEGAPRSCPPAVTALAVALCEPAGGAFGAGEAVSGQVSLELAAPLPVRALRLHAAGRARASWSDAACVAPAAHHADAAAGLEAEVPYLDARQELLLRGDGEPGAGGGAAGVGGAGLVGERPHGTVQKLTGSAPMASPFGGGRREIAFC